MMKAANYVSKVLLVLVFIVATKSVIAQQLYYAPLLVGEVSQNTAIFQARLVVSDSIVYKSVNNADDVAVADLMGMKGQAFFEVSTTEKFTKALKSAWLQAIEQNDFIVKVQMSKLKPGTKYYYRLRYGKDAKNLFTSKVHSFSTLPATNVSAPVDFVMITGSNLDAFYLGAGFGQPTTEGATAYQGTDKFSGFPGIKTITQIKPDFFIGNGDNVYYDLPPFKKAVTQKDMRAKWHRQLGMGNMQRMFQHTATYWMKDDHDHRFDDSDTVSVNERHGELPSHLLGVNTFIEQVPVISKEQTNKKTYRTYKIGSLVQIWMLEGRDYRTPNRVPDGPDKTIWGAEQLSWLKQTLLESDAVYKLLITPTPMIGPDDARKRDNHANLNGFRSERDRFFKWIADNNFLKKNFYILCGDRHWQYHSIDSSGVEEFSCGAIVDQNARLGRIPGDSLSTDPKGLIKQPYSQKQASGGFLRVVAKPGATKGTSTLNLIFYDENGLELYRSEKNEKKPRP